MNNVILDNFTKDQLREEPFKFEIGSTVRVHVKIKEGSRERIQVFEGIVIAKKHGGVVFIPNAEELLGLAKHAKCAVGTRFHLLYLSKRAGIPVFPIGDDPKMTGL